MVKSSSNCYENWCCVREKTIKPNNFLIYATFRVFVSGDY